MTEPLPDGQPEPEIKPDDTTVMPASTNFDTVRIEQRTNLPHLEVEPENADLLIINLDPNQDLSNITKRFSNLTHPYALATNMPEIYQDLNKREGKPLDAGVIMIAQIEGDPFANPSEKFSSTINFIKNVREGTLTDEDDNAVPVPANTIFRVYLNQTPQQEFNEALRKAGLNPDDPNTRSFADFEDIQHDIMTTMPIKPAE